MKNNQIDAGNFQEVVGEEHVGRSANTDVDELLPDLPSRASAARKRAKKVPGKIPKKKSAQRIHADHPRGSGAPGSLNGMFFSRDESWLKFNKRVLEEAEDDKNPLLERVKFLAITASNLDEFVEIRVAGILQQIEEGYNQAQSADEGGQTPGERLDILSVNIAAFVKRQYDCWNNLLLPCLEDAGIIIRRWKKLDGDARTFVEKFYEDEVDPLLTPVTIDPSHPFPRVLNKALCIALLLRHKRRTPDGKRPAPVLGVVTVPRSLPRVISVPSADSKANFIFLHELIEAKVEKMYRGYEVLGKAAFRVTRNSNLYMQEEESRSVLESVREELHNRRKGDAVRLEIENTASDEIVERLRINFELDPWQVIRTAGPVNLSRLMNIYSDTKLPGLKYPLFVGRSFRISPKSEDIFAELRKRDVLLHHPFDSYRTVEEFINIGACDPQVISMKQTLYRTSKDSPIFRALIQAAQSKDVTVVVELMARFDEDSNIRWARELEDAGVGVFHGIVGRKTHCKLALLVRRDPDGHVRRYAHLGTGNYNPVTARFYTDISMLTARPEITMAAQRVFNYLTAEAEAEKEEYLPLMVAPLTLADDFLRLIGREAGHARAGKSASIIAKVNGLLDRKTVEALYAASQAGVQIDLIVRGMCSLRPGVKGISETIRVRSIVGRLLEHSRIFYFENAGKSEVFCGSADWMARNLYERCEVVYPVLDESLAKRLRLEILDSYLRDNVKARVLGPDGEYTRVPQHGIPFNAQEFLLELASAT